MSDEIAEPGAFSKLVHFGVAIARYIASGCENVTPEQYAERLGHGGCEDCPVQRNAKCLLCGCSIESKATMATETCPRVPPRWPELPQT